MRHCVVFIYRCSRQGRPRQLRLRVHDDSVNQYWNPSVSTSVESSSDWSTHTRTLPESLRRRETPSVKWIELIRKAHGRGCCPPARTKPELSSNRKLKNSCNADPPLQAVVQGLCLSPVWTPATGKKLFFGGGPLFLAFALAYFHLPLTTNKRSITANTKAKSFSFFFFFFQYLYL